MSDSKLKDAGTSEEFSSLREQAKELDKSMSVMDQEEEMGRIGEKRNLDSLNDLSLCSDASKLTSVASDSSLLHPLPPSYFVTPQSLSVDSTKSEKSDTSSTFESNGPIADYRRMLIKDLRYETRRQLGLRLDLERTNVANWKSVADELGFDNLEIQNIDNDRNKTQRILNEVEVRFPSITVGDLCQILEGLDRQDVITDMERYFIRDLSRPKPSFMLRDASFQTATTMLGSTSYQEPPRSFSTPQPGSFPSFRSPLVSVTPQQETLQGNPVIQDSLVTTSTSLASSHPAADKEPYPQSLPPNYPGPAPAPVYDQQQYDAFVLYDVADKNFILSEFLPKIEGQAGAKLFIPERDLPAGEHSYDAQLQAMVNNCPKLIVILSDEFLRSPMSRWSLNVGLSLDPAARNRKIIPVIYKRITESSVLAGINACDRTRVLEDSWFWDGLINSLKRR